MSIPDNDAESMVKHLIFLEKFAVLSIVEIGDWCYYHFYRFCGRALNATLTLKRGFWIFLGAGCSYSVQLLFTCSYPVLNSRRPNLNQNIRQCSNPDLTLWCLNLDPTVVNLSVENLYRSNLDQNICQRSNLDLIIFVGQTGVETIFFNRTCISSSD